MSLETAKLACEQSLKFLSTEILGYKDWDLVHDDLEVFLNRKSKRKLILLPRGHLKSSIVTKAYVIQSILKKPNSRVLIANQVWDRARDMLYEIKEFLNGKSELNNIYGPFISKRWRDDEIVINQRFTALSAPTIGTTGVESEMTGSHFDTIILDDLQGLQNCQTKEQREKVKKFYRTMTALLDPGGELIILGTRWHYDDIYNEIIETESKYFDIMVRQVVEDGKIIFPKKFNLKFDDELKDWVQQEKPTMDYIEFLRSTLGPEFYSQFMNNPVDADTQLFKKEYFHYYKRRPEDLFIITTVDPAISYAQRSDYTAIVTCGMDSKRNIYILDTVRGHWASPSEIIHAILQSIDKWKPLQVGIESNGFQKSLKWWMEELVMKQRKIPPIVELKSPVTKTKDLRLKSLEPYYRNGMIFHHETMAGKDLENELLMMTTDGYKGRHDDLFDALAWQLELLFAGSEKMSDNYPVGSFAFEERQARKAINGPSDYFHE